MPLQKKTLHDYFGVNLIKNPGAEEKTVEQKIPNWTLNSEASARDTIHGTYKENVGMWKKGCKDNCGLLPNSGKSYFRLPIETINSRISLSQEIDLSPIADIINERRILTNFDGFVAGTFCENKKCITARLPGSGHRSLEDTQI